MLSRSSRFFPFSGRTTLLAALICATTAGPVATQTYELRFVTNQIPVPTALGHGGGTLVYVASQEGTIHILDQNRVRATPFLDIRGRVRVSMRDYGEHGLLGLAFHPRFADNGFFFVTYSDLDGNSVISRFQAFSPDAADPASERVLLRIPQPGSSHNVGQLQFGPDGYLYVGTGDGDFSTEPLCNAQNGDLLLGKILRLDVDTGADTPPYHAIPPSNPFVGDGGVRDEIWALGLRNPWRFSFDRLTGELYLGDVGQGAREEINVEPPGFDGGRNYGWKMMEGTFCRDSTIGCVAPIPPCDDPAYTPPVHEYGHGGFVCAIVGGHVYRGGAIPNLFGIYVFGDYCGQLWAARPDGAGLEVTAMEPSLPGQVSFGEDAAGEIYLLTETSVYHIADAALNAPIPGTLALVDVAVEVTEDAGEAVLRVTRAGGVSGAVGVGWVTADGEAVAGEDYAGQGGSLQWADGETTTREIRVPILQDGDLEAPERLRVMLVQPTGGAVLGNALAEVTIADDDLPATGCVPGEHVLCLRDGRFQAELRWRPEDGELGHGVVRLLEGEAGGYFFFRNPVNPEVFVKVLDACQRPRPRFWVFAAGLTDVETELVVADTASGQILVYRKALGLGFDPIIDTDAFATCP